MPLNNLAFLVSLLFLLFLCVPTAAHQRFTEFDTIDEFHLKPIIEVPHLDDLTINNITGNGTTAQTVPRDRRVDCLPDGAGISLCATRNCIVDAHAPWGIPKCYFPRNTGYRALTTGSNGTILEKAPGTGSPFGEDIPRITFKATTIKDSTLNVRIGADGRFEPKIDMPRNVYDTGESFDVVISNETGIFSFRVERHSTKTVIWDTSIGGLLFAEQYIQIAAFLGSSEIYGIGENIHSRLKHNVEQYATWSLLARDSWPYVYPAYIEIENMRNLYGVYPFLMAVEKDHKAHGILILNTNPQDITIGPAPHIVYRTIGGILDLYFFPGPLPEDVIRQYLAFVGTPMLPAYWALGFQLGSLGFKNLTDLQTAVDETRKAGIPLDVPFADLQYLSTAEDFAMANGWEAFPSYVEQLHNESLHVIVVLQPAVQADGDPFERALQENASFVEWETNKAVQRSIQNLYPLANKTKIMLGVLRPDKHVAYPDFTTAGTKSWWMKELADFHKTISYDGLWIVRNEPSSLGTNENRPEHWYDLEHTNITSLRCPVNGSSARYDVPLYQTQNVYHYPAPSYLASMTLCMSAMTKQGRMYDVKNLYGLQQTIATHSAMQKITKKRGVLVTRSSYVSGGRYAGHSLGNNYASWEDMSASVVAIQEFNMFGIPYVGADICGYAKDTTEELCLRWQQLGAFYTLSRNRNDGESIPQQPTKWPSVARATAAANLFRYSLLPYLYTLMFEAARNGATVIRPLFFEFPNDDAAHQNSFQFLWGPAILIAPVLDEGMKSVYAYLPRNATWYSLRDDFGIKAQSGFSFLPAPFDQLPPVFLRGGYIIPRQEGRKTTAATRRHPFQLVIAVENSKASGKLIWDDGESIIENFDQHDYIELHFNFTMNDTSSQLILSLFKSSSSLVVPNITSASIFGHNAVPMINTIHREPGDLTVVSKTSYDSSAQIFYLRTSCIFNFATDTTVVITWSNHALFDLAPMEARVNCIPESLSHQSSAKSICAKRGCMWDDAYVQDPIPACYFPKRSGYVASKMTATKTVLNAYNRFDNPFGANLHPLIFSHSHIHRTTLNIRITTDGQRYEPSLNLPRGTVSTGESFIVQESNATDVFSFKVCRKSTNALIWDTSIGGLMFSDQYIQIAAYIGSSELYGIGENIQHQLRHNMEYYMTWGMLSRNERPNYGGSASATSGTPNLYGAYPFYMAFEPDHKAHGVLLLNSNAQDITIGPAPHIVYRTIGGMLDITFFPGPTPEDVIRQYLAFVGKPALPSYWSLGFQYGSDRYKNLTDLENAISAIQNAAIPIDVLYAGFRYMNQSQDFTLAKDWQEFPAYIDKLHNQSMHVIVALDAGLQVEGEPFSRALAAKANFFEWETDEQVPHSIQDIYPLINNTKIMLGVQRPNKHVALPDYSMQATADWWKEEINRFHAKVPFDGLWIDLNEPASFGTNKLKPWYFDDPDHANIVPLMCPLNGTEAKYDVPPYETYNVYFYTLHFTNAYLSSKTFCMLAMAASGRMYDVKNVYGLHHSIATQKALQSSTSKRGIVISRSSYPSGGHYAGHSLGDNIGSWNAMRTSVIGIQQFNMFGIPYVGADVCGYYGSVNAELCLRWHQLGAFYPLMRNRNDKTSLPKDPTQWPDVMKAARTAIQFRYSYLPYLYSLFFNAAKDGGTVVRPLFFEFPEEPATHENSEEFMWGSAILIAPVLFKQSTTVYAYLPYGASWFSLRAAEFGIRAQRGFSFLNASTTELPPVFVRGGSVVPYQVAGNTTVQTRQNPIRLIVAIENKKANGKIYWDDGESIVDDFSSHNYIELNVNFTIGIISRLVLTKVKWGTGANMPNIERINFFGYDAIPLLGTIRRESGALHLSLETTSDQATERFDLVARGIFDFDKDTQVVITWQNHQLYDIAPPEARVTCIPESLQSFVDDEPICEARGCIWDDQFWENAPSCYFPKVSGYMIKSTANGVTLLEDYKGFKNPYQSNIPLLTFTAKSIQHTTLNIRIAPSMEKRYEPMLEIPRGTVETGESFYVEESNETFVFSFKVKRRSTNQLIWDTSIGGLMFADKYIQIAAYLSSSNIYGIGENAQMQLRHLLDSYLTWAMLARDETPSIFLETSDFGRNNLYGVYPFYMALELDGKAHGVLFLNSNPQEITTGPAPHIIYRTIGGILDIYFFPGPRPEDVIQQYLAFVGTPAVPPYWALGFQIDYFASNLMELKNTINIIRDAYIPFDVVYADIEYMDKYQDFTLGKEWEQLSAYVNQLHAQDIHTVLTFDPSISVTGEPFKRALDAKVSFFEWERIDQAPQGIQGLYNSTKDTKIMLGVSWPDAHVAFPDFGAEQTIKWWIDEITTFYKRVPFDGVWISMNEPASFGTDETEPWYFNNSKHTKIAQLICPLNRTDADFDMPPYETFSVFLYRSDTTQSYLSSKTLCMLAVSKSGRIYDVKNLYGLQQSIATQKALQTATSKRGLLLSRSLFPSGGHYAGHSLGDNFATWSDLARSVVGIQLFNMFGIPYVGADICGFHGEAVGDDLCSRWHQLGAFYPLARVRSENRLIPQNLSTWHEPARQAYLFRYVYLPYLYTLHFEAARSGGTVVRPLFFEFPNDDAARGNSEQFMWGSALLIAPVLQPNVTVTYAYLPRSVSWYSLRNDDFGVKAPKGFSFFDVSTSKLPAVFIRGGSIVPCQPPSDTTTATRQNELQFVIAVENSTASGKLIWDDGESIISDFEKHNYMELHIDFTLDVQAILTLTVVKRGIGLKIPSVSILNFVGYGAVPVISTIKREDGGVLNISKDAWADASMERFYLPADGIFDFDKDTIVKITWMNHELFDVASVDARVDCMPEPLNAPTSTQTLCEERFCMWDYTAWGPKPKCYFPKRSGYLATETYADQIILQDYSLFKNPFGQNLSPLYFSARHIKQTTLNIRIFPEEGRYEPQLLIPKDTFTTGESFIVEISNKTKVFSFKVIRKSTNAMIWDTSIGGMMFSDQYIQIAAYIGTSMLYGIGENTQDTLMHYMETYTTYTMFSRNEALSPHYSSIHSSHPKNLYGVFPFYIGFERDGNAHGVFILNSNAQEITLGMAPHIVYRTIGGMLDIFFFPGPTPDDVIRQFTALVGKPALPAYWSLGFQLGRFGYGSLTMMQNTIALVQQANIPLDVVHADIDYMSRYQDFTISSEWEGLSDYITSLHDAGLHAMLTFNPAVQVDGLSFSRALKAGVPFFEWETMSQVPRSIESLYPLTNNTKIMLGVLWQDKHVAYPDFSSALTNWWWSDEVGDFHRKIPFDGMLLDMNEPASFGTNEADPWYYHSPDHMRIEPLMCPTSNNTYDVPPYQTYAAYNYNENSTLASKTLCMLAKTMHSRMYDTKNLYGLQHSIASEQAMHRATSKRPAIITTSSFPSAGHYAGHWLGQNSATWYNLVTSVISIQLFNLFGIPYVGADICGFKEDVTEELCIRWQQLGAFYTFSRNHNDKGTAPRDPAHWPSVAAATRQANLFRYHYLPYLYSLHFDASLLGRTVIRPIFMEFPQDDAARENGFEFMWGGAMLIVPVLRKRVSQIHAYLPHEGTWYSLRDGEYGKLMTSGFQFLSTPINEMIPIFARGGYIMPRQAPAMTTTASRKNPLELLIAMDKKWNLPAKGNLYWDDGESDVQNGTHYKWEFKFTTTVQFTELVITQTNVADMNGVPTLDIIDIFGYPFIPHLNTANINGTRLPIDGCSSFDMDNAMILINCSNLINITADAVIVIVWTNSPLPTTSTTTTTTTTSTTTTTVPKTTTRNPDIINYVDPSSRVDCMPSAMGNPEIYQCHSFGCVFDVYAVKTNVPACYYPIRSGYTQVATNGSTVTLQKLPTVRSPYGDNISPIYFSTEMIEGTTLNVRIGLEGRYKPLLLLPRDSFNTGESFIVEQSNVTGVFSFKVIRKSTKKVIWDTSIGGLMFADQYIQIAAFMGSSFVYGIGENVQQSLSHNLEYYMTWPLFASGQHVDSKPIRGVFSNTRNLYGVYPFYMGVESDYNAHGVLILNSNAQEITFGPAPQIVYRTIGGLLDIYFFPGPTPEDVLKQYLAFVGHPTLPPYWGFGFQFSRYGYKNLDEMKTIINEIRSAQIPLDVAYADIDYMDRYQDFTIGKDWEQLPKYIEQLHSENMHVVLIFNPAIQADGEPFARGLSSNAKFIEWERDDQVPHSIQDLYPLAKGTKIMLGVVWPDKHVSFPDFSDAMTTMWWVEEIKRFHRQVSFDGMWIDMNEPTNFGTDEANPWYFNSTDHPNLEPLMCPLSGNDSFYDMPPYQTYAVYLYGSNSYLSSKTLCMLALTKEGRFYDTKNLYGLHEAIATQMALQLITKKRTLVITRSSYPSAGRYAGHWLGDNSATWDDLRTSIIGVQEFNLFGVPYIGADICGFSGDTTEELCLRWQQLGAFYTFSRNHNEKGATSQQPTVWPRVAAATRQANLFRYYYLPYLYTLHYNISVAGGAIIRPLFFEFPRDDAAHEYDMEFMWGPAMLIAPVTAEGWTEVYAYLPRGATWYSLREFDYGMRAPNGFSFVSAPFDQLIPVFVRGGYILPRQASELTTVASRKNPFEILIALDGNWSIPARGSLFWDDGESLLHYNMYYRWTFTATVTSEITTITITPTHTSALSNIPTLDVIEIFGYPYIPKFNTAQSNGVSVSISQCASYDAIKQLISIKCHNLIKIAIDSPIIFTWTHMTALPTTTGTTSNITPRSSSTRPLQTTTITQPLSESTSGSLATTTVSASNTYSTSYLIAVFVCFTVLLW